MAETPPELDTLGNEGREPEGLAARRLLGILFGTRDPPGGGSVRRGEKGSFEKETPRRSSAGHSGEYVRTAPTRHQSAVHARMGEGRSRRGEHGVTGQDEVEPAASARAVHGSHDRRWETAEAFHDAPAEPRVGQRAAHVERSDLREVGPGKKDRRMGGGKDEGRAAQGQLIQSRAQVTKECRREYR